MWRMVLHRSVLLQGLWGNHQVIKANPLASSADLTVTSALKIQPATSIWPKQKVYKVDLAFCHMTTTPICCVIRRKGKQIQVWHYVLNHLVEREAAFRSTTPLTKYSKPWSPGCHFRLAQGYVYSFLSFVFSAVRTTVSYTHYLWAETAQPGEKCLREQGASDAGGKCKCQREQPWDGYDGPAPALWIKSCVKELQVWYTVKNHNYTCCS